MHPAPSRPDVLRYILRDVLILALVAGATLLIALGRHPAHRIQELRVLEVAREMRESGEVVLPRLCGEPRYRKPPLAYWLALAGYEAAGDESEAAGRAYSALSGLAAALILYALGRSSGSPRLGLWAGIVLLTSLAWIRASRTAETDALLGATVAAALYAFWRAFGPHGGTRGELHAVPGGRNRLGWIVLGWAAMAAGTMSKSLAGLTYPLLAAAIYLGASRRWRDLRALFHPAGILLFLLLAGLWPAMVLIRDPSAVETFLLEMEVTAGGRGHGKAWYYALVYYLFAFWPAFVPWCALFVPAAIAALAAMLRPPPAGSPSDAPTTPLVRFFLAWAASILLQLELVGNKQPHYLVPAIPAFAGIVAWWLDAGAPGIPVLRPPRPARLLAGLAAATAVVAVALAWVDVEGTGKSRRTFGLLARRTVGGAPVWSLGRPDPELWFHLDRAVPGLDAHRDRARLDELVRGGSPFFVLSGSRDREVAAREAAILAERGRFEPVLRSGTEEAPATLYRFGGSGR